jgi:hypothetical protein
MGVQLDVETINKLKAYDTTMMTLAKEIDRAERAGIDVAALKDQFIQIESLRQGLLKEYALPDRNRKVSGAPRRGQQPS